MGCVYSQEAESLEETNSRIFRVWNFDDAGHESNPGKLEITDSDLIIYQKGKRVVHWPLGCLRRYGFDAEIFSFESGRRCLTGRGIFAFKCRRSEVLFNLLQVLVRVYWRVRAFVCLFDYLSDFSNSCPFQFLSDSVTLFLPVSLTLCL